MSVKNLLILAGFLLAFASTNANAWFFFIPGSVVGKIGDSISGAEGEHCVAASAKVGDVQTLPSGNTRTIKSLSGTSARCSSKELPIRALLEFSFNFVSKAGIDIPDGYEQKPLSDTQRFQGFFVKAENPVNKTGFVVTSRKRDKTTDAVAVARAISDSMAKILVDAKTANEEEVTVNGMKALRFELTGKNKGVFGRTYTYMVTLLEGDDELLTINAWAMADDYADEKESFKKLSLSVKGLSALETSAQKSSPPTSSIRTLEHLPTPEAIELKSSSSTTAAVPQVSVAAPEGAESKNP